MSDYTPETLRACFAEEMGVVLPPGSMTPETAAYVAGKFADAWQEQVRELKQALAHNIRDRCIRMIEQGYRTAAEQQPFFPDVPPDVLGYVFAEPFVERLAASEPPGEKQG